MSSTRPAHSCARFPDAEASEWLRPAAGGSRIDPTNGDVLITAAACADRNEYDSSGQLPRHGHRAPPAAARTGRAGGQLGRLPLRADRRQPWSTSIRPGPAGPEISIRAGVARRRPTSGTLNATVDPNGGGPRHRMQIRIRRDDRVRRRCTRSRPGRGSPVRTSRRPTDVSAAVSGPDARRPRTTTGSVVKDANGVKYGDDQVYTPARVLGLDTDPATASRTNPAPPSTARSSATAKTPTTTSNGARRQPTGTRRRRHRRRSPAGPGPDTAARPTMTGLGPVQHLPLPGRRRQRRRLRAVGADRMFTTTPGVPRRARPDGDGGALRSSRPAWRSQPERGNDDGPVRIRRRRRLPGRAAGPTLSRRRPRKSTRDGQALPERSAPWSTGLAAGNPLPLPGRRRPTSTGTGDAEATFRTFAFIAVAQRPLPERPRPPADRCRPAARLPRL